MPPPPLCFRFVITAHNAHCAEVGSLLSNVLLIEKQWTIYALQEGHAIMEAPFPLIQPLIKH